jgi:hypothetical protein
LSYSQQAPFDDGHDRHSTACFRSSANGTYQEVGALANTTVTGLKQERQGYRSIVEVMNTLTKGMRDRTGFP